MAKDISPPQPYQADQLARAREDFLAAGHDPGAGVREAILASWRRSLRWNVSADRVDLHYQSHPDLDTPLAQSAAPVLHQLRDQLVDEPVSAILTDTQGIVLARWTGDSQLERQLDKVHLVPGFTYAEQFVGTNGIGTALASGQPTHVFGHEHYAEHLENLACAGVPIQHPVTKAPVGLLDLTCWNRDAGPLLMALAKSTAQRIERAMLSASGQRELALLREYIAACRRSAGIVMAINNDVVMMNDAARATLDSDDQGRLLSRSSEAISAARPLVFLVELQSGSTARLHCTPVWSESGLAGCLLDVAIDKEVPRPRLAPTRTTPAALPGLAGSATSWLKCCQQVAQLHAIAEAVVVEGEAGVGKLAIVRAVHLHANPGGHLRVLDAECCESDPTWIDELRSELDGDDGTLVLRHLESIPPAMVSDVRRAIREARMRWKDQESHPWLVATLRTSQAVPSPLSPALDLFPSSVTVPPLHSHIEDIRELVPFLLGRLRPRDDLRCSSEALQVLLRARWTGNIAQLVGVLSKTVRHRRTGVIQPDDLPPEARARARRVLTPLESLERDAIVTSLIHSDGNKTRAAGSLGMSRATIYRKIREFGIDLSVLR